MTPLPATGEAFLDARGPERALRVSWHAESDVIVLSLWQGGTCTGSFRLPAQDVPDLIEALRAGLSERPSGELGEADKFVVLRRMRFFSAFADPELWEVIALSTWLRVSSGTAVVREGEHGDFFCMLIQGEARVSKNKKLLSVLGPGECFGEMAYLSLSGHARGATVTAARDALIMQVRVGDLGKASADCRSKFDRAFIGILVERLNLANTRLTSG